MKYCANCGKELLDEAVICVGCGCSIEVDESTNSSKELDEIDIKKRKKKKKKIIIIVTAAICAAVVLVFVSIPIINSFRADKIINELSGEEFEYNDDTSYSRNRDCYTFDNEGNCEDYSYYYSIILDEPWEITFDLTYEIEFEKNSAYVVLSNDDKLKIKYDEEGEIIGLYNSEERKTYERK